jgi:hypothetical protein
LTGPPTGHALRILLNCSSSASRPTKALRVAAKGSPERPRSRQARVGASKPFSWISPSASHMPRPERPRYTSSESNVCPGPAAATRRAAKFTESPSTV